MKVGISTASLFLKKPTEDALPLIKQAGADTAEVFLSTFSEYKREYAETLAVRCDGLPVNSVHILNTQIEPQFFNGYARVREDAYTALDEILSSANALGAKYYTFHGIARYKKSSRDVRNDNFAKWGARLAEVASACESKGVRLCLENVEWSTYNRVGVFAELKRYVPNLLGVLDTKQARLSGEPYENYLQEMGESLAYVHLSDVDERGKIRLPGQGNFPFEELLKRLQGAGFDGALLIEVYTNDYGAESELKTACEYIDELLYKYN
jgi:sugar phosphate isomerase/epimerase